MGHGPIGPGAKVIAFPAADRRAPGREPAPGEPRSRILLFTGVRYERMGEPGPDLTPRRASEPQVEGRRGRG